MDKQKYVKVPLDVLAELIEAKEELSALENGGVDNWEWYGECFDTHIEDTPFDDWYDYISNATSEDEITKEYELLN